MEANEKYVDVILPLALPQYFTYIVPENLVSSVQIGKRVIVQFGGNKFYSGLIRKVKDSNSSEYQLKYIEEVLDNEPVIPSHYLDLWEWIAEYYMCSIGEVMNAGMPSAFKLSSDSVFYLSEGKEVDEASLTPKEFLIFEALNNRNELNGKDIQAILNQKSIQQVVNGLIEKEIIFVKEELQAKYKPRFENYLQLNELLEAEEEMESAFELLNRAPAQQKALMAFIHLSHEKLKINRQDLVKESGVSNAVVAGLIKRGMLVEQREKVSRLRKLKKDFSATFTLNDEQQIAFDQIRKSSKNILLHGVTGSGKTMVYIEAIREVIADKKQVLYLVPEIALTSQLVERLKVYFGNDLGTFHSKFNTQEQVEIWNNVRSGHIKVLLGARSSCFLPFRDLGLIIVDEEHDKSYSQHDPAPRYNAKEVALKLATLVNCKVILGSGTPSVNSYYRAKNDLIELVEIKNRYENLAMPKIHILDLNRAYRTKSIKNHFTKELVQEIEHVLDKQEQVLLFQNRRGYSPYLQCTTCSWIPQCIHCDVSLTYHKFSNDLRCHYCGYRDKLPAKCKNCSSQNIDHKSFGTQLVEQEIQSLFPSASVQRMDSDTVKNKYGHEKILERFEKGDIDILVGTQMITKGLDFDNVSTVAVINADMILSFPSYDSGELAFQVLSQVSGRSGRKKKQGNVFIQTGKSDHPIMKYVIEHNYKGFYQHELFQRKEFNYPPYMILIEITLKHRNKKVLLPFCNELGSKIRKNSKAGVLGPTEPVISKIRDLYIRNITIKLIKSGTELAFIRNLLLKSIEELKMEKVNRSIKISFKVDAG